MFRNKTVSVKSETERRKDWLKINNGYTLTWQDLSIYVKVRQKGNGQPYKRLIDNVGGIVRPSSLVVLMGPSGAGKSTLMEALAYRSSGDVVIEGDVRINGKPLTKDFRRISGFLHQEDLFVETLTVREHLEFMARLKLNTKGLDVGALIEKHLTETNLMGIADMKIGRLGDKSRISGGERKRLAFATEVLTNPMVLFCDEPTTGLDSFSAMLIVTLMKDMTKKGKTILCTVHQPSSELFAMFNDIILLTEGRTAFIGNKNEAIQFFQERGYSCPDNYNPAEIIVEALSLKPTGDSMIRLKKLCDQFSISTKALKMEDEINQMIDTDVQEYSNSSRSPFGPSVVSKFYWLIKRNLLQVIRDPSVQTIRILQKLGIALMASLCFQGNVALSQMGIQAVQGAIFILITENTFPPMYGVLSVYADEYPLLLRERKNNLYSITLYYVAKLISLLPGLILEPILFVFVAYFIVGFKETIYAFLMTCLIVVLTANVASACGSFFVNTFQSVSVVMALLVPIDYILMVTSGLFVKLSSLPIYISWFRYFSWFMYANEAISIVQWENVYNITCEYESHEVPCLKTGQDVLNKFTFSPSHLSQDLAFMGLMYFVFHILACFFLWWRTSKSL